MKNLNTKVRAEALGRLQAEKEIAALSISINKQRNKIAGAQLRLEDARNAFDGYNNKYSKSKYERDRADMKAAQDSLEQARTDLRSERETLTDLEKRRIELQTKLNADWQVTAEQVVLQQQDIAEQQEELRKLQGAIEVQEEIIRQAQCREDNTQDLIQKRKNLLADAALGHDNAKELETAEKELEVVRKEHEMASSKKCCQAETSQHTIEGLQQRADAVQANIEISQQLHKQLAGAFVLSQIKHRIADYTQSAHALNGEYRRISALCEIASKTGQAENLDVFFIRNYVGPMDLIIPLPDFNSKNGNVDAVRYLKSNNRKDDLSQDIAAVKAELMQQGIEILI